MNTRLLAISVLVLLVIAGLVAGLFAGSIQRALTIPQNSATLPRSKAPMQMQAAPTTTGTMTSQMPANAPLAQDTFQRNDQQFWGTASDGRAWTGDANTRQAFSITGTMGQIANGQGTFDALLGPALNANVEVFVTGSVNRYVQGNANLGVVVRWNDTSNWYKALINGTALTILKRVNGKSIQLSSMPFLARNATLYALRFRAIGAMLFAKAWQRDTPEPAGWMLNATDSTFATGQIGIRVLVQMTSIIKITSFLATSASTTM